MPGQATVTVNEVQWSVSVASTSSELIAGLSNVPSIDPQTGILFDMGSDQSSIVINTSSMLFNMDILFINSSGGVVDISRDVAPNDEVSFDSNGGLGAQYFMEVNAGELSSISVGMPVIIEGYVPGGGNGGTGGIDISSLGYMMIVAMMVIMMFEVMEV